MSNQQFEQALRDQIDQLDKDIQPERDLWPGIELALAKEEGTGQAVSAPAKSGKKATGLVALAASVALVGVLSWSSLQPEEERIDGDQLIALLSAQHAQQKDALLVKFEGQPALTENWQSQLKELDEAASAIKAALKQEPNNIALLKMLQQVHQQQIDLIERVHAPKWRQI